VGGSVSVVSVFRSETVQQLIRLTQSLPPRRLRALLWLLPLSLIPGVIDFLSITVVARLTGALSGSRLQDLLPGVRVFGGDRFDQTVWLISLFIVLIWVRSIAKTALVYVQETIIGDLWYDLASSIYARLLSQPYEYHLSVSRSRLSSDVLGNLTSLAKDIVTPLIRSIGSLSSIVVLSIGVFVLVKGLAVLLFLVMGLSYLVLSILITPRLRHASRQKVRSRSRYTHAFLEGLGSVRDIKLTAAEAYFETIFSSAARDYRQHERSGVVLPQLPRQLIEPLGITAIFLIGAMPMVLSGDSASIQQVLPLLATMSVAALRLTPPLQELFGSLAKLRGGLPEISTSLALLDLPPGTLRLGMAGVPSPAGLFPRRTVRLVDVNYSYPGSSSPVLQGINLIIPIGARVAFVGTTGSGKTTTANLLLGLLQPNSGELQLDGLPLSGSDIPAWQASCAQVPQFIQLLDASVLNNVAFGIDHDQIDVNLAWDALESAQLAEFVADLPYGVHTPIGENGIQLSGGQRQRLAMARAFYRRAQFLVLDEATSALDNKTESDVIQALELIGRRCTTVVVAHRLTTVQRCDRIYEFEAGRIKAFGTYDQLLNSSDSFRRLAQLDSQ
jgi:ATP-binding cassette subfamily B protein